MNPAQHESRHAAITVGADNQPIPRETQLAAYNAAFIELGLRFRWDAAMYEWLCGIECEKGRVARYIEEHHPHLLAAYDAAFLSGLIFEKKNEYLRAVGHLN
ncbi:conserved hypothetical protein [Cupriavidus taiwanensis]|uniref:Uncharacterized protein n=1 Tax=Cupriavidus taiwanensis TaxID=164546 RepID=A0A975XFB3_9BURK|nr:LysR family transcriptional regulator [Cupriavidus taiwanensis]SOY68405.1 conserved hypothetical protein [Cupriavidus taiwanensis]